VDIDRGACEESGAEGQFSEHTQGETHVPTIAGLHKIGDGYYYDVERVRYRHLGEEGQYTYEQVASVFKADKDRVSSPAVDAMVSKAIDYVTTDTPPRSPNPQSCSSYMIAEHLHTKDRTRYQLSHLKQLLRLRR
jgi:hypothetical protein